MQMGTAVFLIALGYFLWSNPKVAKWVGICVGVFVLAFVVFFAYDQFHKPAPVVEPSTFHPDAPWKDYQPAPVPK
jgi:hypothetical protein